MRIKPLKYYGYLTFIKEMPDRIIKNERGYQQRRRNMMCKCICGTIKVFDFFSVHHGYAKSCGCLTKTLLSIAKGTHHSSRTKEYDCWCSMKERCCNPENKQYGMYGGSGVIICERWINSYENFISDMGIAPTKKHSLDRFPDNNGNYELSNCRWATAKQQARNLRNNVYINFRGEEILLIELCEKFNINYTTARSRISNKWDIEEVFAPKHSMYHKSKKK